MSSILMFLALGLSALTGYVIYRENEFRGDPLPGRDGRTLLSWLQSAHHWHDFGHFFLEFVLTFMTQMLYVVALSILVSLRMGPWFAETIFLPAIQLLVRHPILMAFLATIPSTILTLCVEIIGDQHWKSFVGKPDDTRDFLFDVFTHLSGAVTAALLLAALNLAVQKLVMVAIMLALAGVL